MYSIPRPQKYVCTNYQRTASVSEMLESLKWDTLEERRHKNRTSMFFKILHSLVAIPRTQLLPTGRETRGNSTKFHQLPTSQAYHTNTFFPSAIKIWNSLPSTLSSITDLDIFEEHLNSTSMELGVIPSGFSTCSEKLSPRNSHQRVQYLEKHAGSVFMSSFFKGVPLEAFLHF